MLTLNPFIGISIIYTYSETISPRYPPWISEHHFRMARLLCQANGMRGAARQLKVMHGFLRHSEITMATRFENFGRSSPSENHAPMGQKW